MPLSSSVAVKQLSDGNSQGTVLGQSATDLIGFYGATPIARTSAVGASSAISTGTFSSTGAFGFGDATTASTIAQAVIALKQMGLI